MSLPAIVATQTSLQFKHCREERKSKYQDYNIDIVLPKDTGVLVNN